MKIYILLIAVFMTLVSCKDTRQSDRQSLTPDAVTNDMVDIDEITEIESIIADSTLENATGDPAWKREGSRKIIIKKNGRYYLRMKARDGSIITTTLTYKYDE